ncbi:MAG TPA: DNA translocase FtsK 4TM domain-containing protein, partial [Candidatus Binatia bacterium]|nr:DNA translocase FtsK 4TM domain-containing protein [Candidatus Binatia bacterium]
IFLTAVLILSLLSPNQGQLTAALSGLLRQAFGWGGIFVALVMGTVGFYLVLWGMEQAPKLPALRLLGVALLFLTFEAFASLTSVVLENGLATVWDVAQAQTGGGYVGGLLAWALTQAVGRPGAIFVYSIVGLIAAVLLFGVTRRDLGQFLQTAWDRRPQQPTIQTDDREIPINTGRTPGQNAIPAASMPGNRSAATSTTAASLPGVRGAVDVPGREPVTQPNGEPSDSQGTERGTRRARQSKPAPPAEPVTLDTQDANGSRSWELPRLEEMLEAGGDQEISNAAIREQVEIIEHTLESFGAPAKVVEINQGPTVTQYGVEPQFIEQRSGRRTKVKVGKISSLADDLALALAAHSVRVQAPVPGKGYVGLEVPNTQKALVSLRDVMESPAFTRIRSPLRIGLGQNVSGQAIAADLMKMPHLLIAGATGAGKSICVNGIIACLLLQNTPEDLRMVMVDPKRVELTGYNGIPHLVAPVVVDMERVIGTLQWALREMDMRYQRLAEVGARNISDYNKKVQNSDKQKMPFVVIVIDELADLMMISPEDTERSITRLAQMARATGIHMIISTQRPSVDVVTGLIKTNFPARVAFAVASGTDSRVILDTTGAERLLGQGDMLFQSPDAGAPVRLQGSFVSDAELSRIISYWRGARRRHTITAADAVKKAEASTTAPPPTQQPLWEDLIEQEKESEYEDELVPEAIALVRELGKASTSLLQRRFRIGYTRAARIMDVMEEEGIIGPPTGTSKAREVLDEDEHRAADGDGEGDGEGQEDED